MILFTPDGSKLLVSQYLRDKVFFYLDSETGAMLGGIYQQNCCQRIRIKDAIALTSTGDKVLALALRPQHRTITLKGVHFDGSSFSNFATYFNWEAEQSHLTTVITE